MNDQNTDRRPTPSRLRSPATAWSLLFTAILLGGIFASGAPAARQDTSSVSAVVQRQLQALAADDAGTAFALTDPGLRTRFGNPDEFLAMLRAQYPMVVEPTSVLFLKPHRSGSMALQKVRLTDAEGSGWMATYVLQRQGDRWLITECIVAPDAPQIIV